MAVFPRPMTMRKFGQQSVARLALAGYLAALVGAMSLHHHAHVPVLAEESEQAAADVHRHGCGHHHHSRSRGASSDPAPHEQHHHHHHHHHHHSPFDSDDCSICQWLAEKPLVTVHTIVFEFSEISRDVGLPEIVRPDAPSPSLPPSRGPPALG